MSTAEHEFINAFYTDFAQNGDTGVPNVFMKEWDGTEAGHHISSDEFDQAGHLLEDSGVAIVMRGLEHSTEGSLALFKTAAEIPADVAAQLKKRNHLGQVGLGHIIH